MGKYSGSSIRTSAPKIPHLTPPSNTVSMKVKQKHSKQHLLNNFIKLPHSVSSWYDQASINTQRLIVSSLMNIHVLDEIFQRLFSLVNPSGFREFGSSYLMIFSLVFLSRKLESSCIFFLFSHLFLSCLSFLTPSICQVQSSSMNGFKIQLLGP